MEDLIKQFIIEYSTELFLGLLVLAGAGFFHTLWGIRRRAGNRADTVSVGGSASATEFPAAAEDSSQVANLEARLSFMEDLLEASHRERRALQSGSRSEQGSGLTGGS